MAIFSTLKEKILSFLDLAGIRKVDFFEATGIQPSNFKGINVKSAPGGDMLVKVLTTYPQLSAEWLMRGEGAMLRNNTANPPQALKETATKEVKLNRSSKTEDFLPPSALTELVSTIREQAEEIGVLKERVRQLEQEKNVTDVSIKTSPMVLATSPTD